MSVAQSDRKVRCEVARGAMEVAVTKSRGAVEVAQFEGRADSEKTVSTTSIECEKVIATRAPFGAESSSRVRSRFNTALARPPHVGVPPLPPPRPPLPPLRRQALRECKLAASTQVKAAEAKKTSAGFLAQARETEAKATGEATLQVEEKLRYEQQCRLATVDGLLASKGRKFLSGDAGDAILKSFVMVRDDLA